MPNESNESQPKTTNDKREQRKPAESKAKPGARWRKPLEGRPKETQALHFKWNFCGRGNLTSPQVRRHFPVTNKIARKWARHGNNKTQNSKGQCKPPGGIPCTVALERPVVGEPTHKTAKTKQTNQSMHSVINLFAFGSRLLSSFNILINNILISSAKLVTAYGHPAKRGS